MYFSATQYPALRGQTKPAIRALITEALRRHDRWARWRFYGFMAALLVLVVAHAIYETRWNPAEWSGLAMALVAGLLFYLYMLWEINGPIHAAVMKYLATNGDPGEKHQ